MKTKALLFAICSLPFAIVAASSLSGHQAFGNLRFGTPKADAENLFRQSHHGKDPHQMTAAEARMHFVTNGAMKISRMEDYDRALPVFVYFRGEPFVNEVAVQSNIARMDSYDSLKKAWEDFQDFGDCKFQRKSERGTFAPMAAVDAAPLDDAAHARSVITDIWETEGVRIELTVQSVDVDGARKAIGLAPRAVSAPMYRVALIATEIGQAK